VQSKLSTESIDILDLWSRLDLRQLAAFRAIQTSGSVARAAERLGYTQPAVSHQLATLEQLVGARLFDRSSGRTQAVLTPAGQLFAVHVAAFERQLASARADLDALEAGAGAPLRVGTFQSVSGRIIPPLVTRLSDDGGSIGLALTETTEEQDLIRMLAAGELDFAFVLMPTDEDHLEAIELLTDPFSLVGSVEQELPSEINSLQQLDGLPLIAPRTCRSWTAVADQLVAAGITPTYAFRTDDNLAIKGLIQAGNGFGLLSQLALDVMGDGLRTWPLEHLIAPRRIGLAWGRSRALVPHQPAFIALVQEVCASLESRGAGAPRATMRRPVQPATVSTSALNSVLGGPG
jgi:DNA-binding transcriptional LysR family regulator